MSFLVIIRGPLGVGKSTISKKMVDSLRGTYVSIDDILSEYKLDVVDESLGCIPEINFLEINQIIIPRLEKAVKNNLPVIVDGNFYYKKQIEDLIKNFSKSYVFTLSAPLELCIERDSKRYLPHGKLAAIAVYKMVSNFDYGQVIDVKDLSAEEVVKIILSKINL